MNLPRLYAALDTLGYGAALRNLVDAFVNVYGAAVSQERHNIAQLLQVKMYTIYTFILSMAQPSHLLRRILTHRFLIAQLRAAVQLNTRLSAMLSVAFLDRAVVDVRFDELETSQLQFLDFVAHHDPATLLAVGGEFTFDCVLDAYAAVLIMLDLARHPDLKAEITRRLGAAQQMALTSYDIVSPPQDLILGIGGFGTVSTCTWLSSGLLVAKKELNDAAGQAQAANNALEEISMWRYLSHPNVLPLLGVSLTAPRPFMLMPYMPRGTLRTFAAEPATGADVALCKLREVSHGVAYLHSMGIVHGDLKADNVLIDADGGARVADFGLSRTFTNATQQATWTIGSAGNVRWYSPERITAGSEGRQFPPDVYAFAMLCYEVVSRGVLPYFVLERQSCIYEAVRAGLRPHMPENVPAVYGTDFWPLVVACWGADPWQRPTFKDIVAMFDIIELLRPANPMGLQVPLPAFQSVVELMAAAAALVPTPLLAPVLNNAQQGVANAVAATGGFGTIQVRDLALTPADLAYLAKILRDSQRIDGIALINCGLTDADLAALVPHLPTGLYEVDFSQNPITDIGYVILATRGMFAGPVTDKKNEDCWSALGVLRVLDTQISDMGPCALRTLGYPPTLVELAIGSPTVTDLGLLELFSRLPANLDSLTIRGAAMTDLGALALSRLNELRNHMSLMRLNLRGSPGVTAAGAQLIVDAVFAARQHLAHANVLLATVDPGVTVQPNVAAAAPAPMVVDP
ncbi:hypothetical protein H9P43_006011 [Blastocladiella emersonii ATCC 22665]|nr:hypothetical protein H9P43_006011 [Blastocladiella emersonii ATCC 22665]